jgi:hypothetical protein
VDRRHHHHLRPFETCFTRDEKDDNVKKIHEARKSYFHLRSFSAEHFPTPHANFALFRFSVEVTHRHRRSVKVFVEIVDGDMKFLFKNILKSTKFKFSIL